MQQTLPRRALATSGRSTAQPLLRLQAVPVKGGPGVSACALCETRSTTESRRVPGSKGVRACRAHPQLPHAGIHKREPSAATLPGPQHPGVLPPLLQAQSSSPCAHNKERQCSEGIEDRL